MLAQTGVADIFVDERGVVKKRRHPDASGGFLARARHAARVRHPNVVEVREVGLDGDLPYYVMEHVEAATLGERRGEPMAAGEVARIGIEIARGLAALHAVGFVHGAITPEHLFDGARIQIGGFDARLGSPWYTAPEQWSSRHLDAELDVTSAVDVYALGCVLFECATGRAPFEADSVTRLAELHRGSKPPSLDGPLGELCAVLLAKEPHDRPPVDTIEAALAATGATGTRR